MRLSLSLAILGLIGLLSLLLVPLERLLPVAGDSLVLRALGLVQPLLLLLVAILAGSSLAPKLGLDAPALAAAGRGERAWPVLRRQLRPAMIVAVSAAVILLLYSSAQQRHLGETVALLPKMPLVTRLLYGGISEEIIARWGVMTLFAWVAWRLIGGSSPPAPAAYWIGNIVAALLFAAGHLPLLFLLFPAPPDWLLVATLLGNMVPGLAFGWLFWRYGLEAAMIAHGTAHFLTWVVGTLTPSF